MANTFREQAEDRFTRSLAFMSKADSLLQDDLVNRSALADAVSAIKNMMQGYLLLRVSQTPPSGITQRWQEVAAGNSMPDLLHCCGDAGLNLGSLAYEIKQLNRERNSRMHDDPIRRIDAQQAKKALDLARDVQKRIRAAVRGEAVAEPPAQPAAVQRIAAVTRAAVSGRLGRDRLKSVTAAPAPAPVEAPPPVTDPTSDVTSAPVQDSEATAEDSSISRRPEREPAGQDDIVPPSQAPAGDATTGRTTAPPEAAPQAEAQASAPTSGDDTPDDADSDDDLDVSADTAEVEIVAPVPRKRRRSVGRALLRGLAAAVLLIVGVAAGAVLTVPVVEGHAPTWLAFAANVVPAMPTATPVTPTVTAAPRPQDGPLFAGAFMVGAPACAGPGKLSLALHNAATVPASWTAGTTDGYGVTFAPRPGVPGTATLAGRLASGSTATVYLTSTSGTPYHVVVVVPDGTIQLLAPAC